MPDWATWTCRGAPEDGLSVAIAPLTKESKTPGHKHCPRSTSGHQPGFSGVVSSHVLHFMNWTIFWFVTKFLYANAAVWKFTCGEELFGGQLEWMVPSLWLLLAFQNFFQFFLNHSSVCRQRGWDFAGWYRWPVKRGFLAVLFFCLSLPLLSMQTSKNVVVLCFASRNHRFTLILFFWCLAVSGGWLRGAEASFLSRIPLWEGL